MLISNTPQGIKLIYFVKRSIEEVLFSLCCTHHESRISHVGINLLNNEIVWTLALILVGTLAHHLFLPLLFTLQVFHVALTDILHNHRNRHLHAAFTSTCTS